MKVTEKVSGQDLIVYGVYWSGERTYFCCFPRESKGMSSYAEDEVEVVDFDLGSDFAFAVMANGIRGVFNKGLLQDGLLDGLLEFDPESYSRFAEVLGHAP